MFFSLHQKNHHIELKSAFFPVCFNSVTTLVNTATPLPQGERTKITSPPKHQSSRSWSHSSTINQGRKHDKRKKETCRTWFVTTIYRKRKGNPKRVEKKELSRNSDNTPERVLRGEDDLRGEQSGVRWKTEGPPPSHRGVSTVAPLGNKSPLTVDMGDMQDPQT